MIPAWRRCLGGEDGWGPRARTQPRWSVPRSSIMCRLITDNYDRSRALQELAREAILSNQLLLAHRTLRAGRYSRARGAKLIATRSIDHRSDHHHRRYLTETSIREGKTQPAHAGASRRASRAASQRSWTPSSRSGWLAWNGSEPGYLARADHQSHLSQRVPGTRGRGVGPGQLPNRARIRQTHRSRQCAAGREADRGGHQGDREIGRRLSG